MLTDVVVEVELVIHSWEAYLLKEVIDLKNIYDVGMVIKVVIMVYGKGLINADMVIVHLIVNLEIYVHVLVIGF